LNRDSIGDYSNSTNYFDSHRKRYLGSESMKVHTTKICLKENPCNIS